MQNAKIRITGMIEYPLYQKLNDEAKKEGIHYIVKLSQILKKHFKD